MAVKRFWRACVALALVGVACGDDDLNEVPPAATEAAAARAAAGSGAAASSSPAALEAAVGAAAPTPMGCALGAAEASADGSRRVAFLVGVGDYKSADIPDLEGPEADVAAMHRLLTDPLGGYGFPANNVCVLTGEAATLAAVKSTFKAALTDRVGGEQDEVLFYFSGHGSQRFDQGGDEADGWDETFVLYDSRTGDTGDLLDDDLNRMLTGLHAKTPNITVILDSCNSGSAAKGLGDTRSRLIPAPPPSDTTRSGDDAGDGGGWWSRNLDGVVVLSAAEDGTSALEPVGGGLGFFTQALVDILMEVGPEPLTWSQVAARAPARIAVLSNERQRPVFQGKLDRYVFDARERARPMGYEVSQIGDTLELKGYALPGWGEGAVVRIYPGNARGAETRDPSKAKASARVVSMSDNKVVAALISEDAAPEVGDIAVLAVASPEAWRLPFVFASGEGAVTPAQRAAVEAELKVRTDIALLLKPGEPGGMTLGADAEGRLRLLGAEGRVRVVLPGEPARQAKEAARALGRFARQRALLSMQGEGGLEMSDESTLQVRAVRSQASYACAPPASHWARACPNQEQVVPVCGTWELRVKNTHPSKELWVGGVILWNNGDIEVFPSDGVALKIPPGVERNPSDKVYDVLPPVDLLDHVLVFGTTDPSAFNLLQLQGAVGLESKGAASSNPQPLELLLQQVTSGSKAGSSRTVGASTWTRSTMPLRAAYNIHFSERDTSEQSCETSNAKEYTVNDFDIAPYLPSDTKSPLYRVLTTADALANASEKDGIPYKQHDWSGADDAANLALGIDCSRSIWYAFTRSGLSYNAADEYLPTLYMVGEDSKMSEAFEDCLDEPELRTGDVLVYRGENSKGNEVGHTVMVVDVDKRIAWGSHGWDGSTNAEGERTPDTGVEYQQIKHKSDWNAWDRKSITLKACWRYKDFADTPDARDELPPGRLSCNERTCDVEVR